MSASDPQPLVWITGNRGFIGSHLARSAGDWAPGFRVRGISREETDLLDPAAVERLFKQDLPARIIHCAAMSENPACEARPDQARRVNTEAAAFLAELAAEIPFYFLSTDLVFDGRADKYDETGIPNPLSVYGETKLAAECRVLANPRHTVIRTSMTGGVSPSGRHSFNERMRLAWQAGQSLSLFVDEFRCPMAVPLTVRAIWALVLLDRPGLYHLAGRECLSRWEIGQAVAKRYPETHPRLTPESIRSYAGAPRPQRVHLDCGRLQALLSFPLLGLREWLDEHPHEPF